jgi:murein L,D-transpeptidase YcbB/YkuD
MPARLKFIAIIAVSLLLVACKVKSPGDLADGGKPSSFSATDYQECLKGRYSSLSSSFINEFPNLTYLDTLRNFYATRQFQSLFFQSFSDTIKIDELVKALSACSANGLPQYLYNIDKIKEIAAQANNNTADPKQRYAKFADVEILLSNAILTYAYHLRYGAVNPTKLYPENYTLPVTDSSKADLFAPLRQADMVKYLKDIEPASPRYKALQKELRHFTEMSGLDWKPFHAPDHKLKRGDKSPMVQNIALRLAQLGFIDSTKSPLNSFTTYNQTLVDAVVAFQRSQGLIDDGTIGKPTIDKLNIRPWDYVDQIKINLERFRWNDYTGTKKYVYVNVPDFYLHVVENGHEKLKIKVCAGRKRPANFDDRMKKFQKTRSWHDKPDDWETPTVASEIFRIVLNPTWSVPRNIIREEIYPGFMKDPNYLKKRHFTVYLRNKAVDLDAVDLKKYSPVNVPYSFVQNSGEGNALGKIKFLFKNKFDIYLHDTPTRGPFGNSIRAVSHGCMRVEKPLELAEFLLEGNSSWNMDYVKTEIGAPGVDRAKAQEYREMRAKLRKAPVSEKSTNINLDPKIPVFVDYYTAWVDENGVMNLRTDVYGRDNQIKKTLFGRQ